jgi:hypothetical protein
MRASRGIDPDNPQGPEGPLFGPSVTVGKFAGSIHRISRNAIEASSGTSIPLGCRQNFFSSLARLDAFIGSGHFCYSLLGNEKISSFRKTGLEIGNESLYIFQFSFTHQL